MEITREKNKTADLSDYLESNKSAEVSVRPFGSAERKKKIYILIIVICISLSVVFYGMYFKQIGGGISQEIVPSQTPASFIPGPVD